MVRTVLRMLALLGLVGLLILPAGPLAAEAVQRLLYEVLPSDPSDADVFDAASFDRRSTATARAAGTLVPAILRVLGHDPARARTELTYGGWQVRTNPTLHTVMPVSEEAADRLAAAFGFVFRQDSVMVFRFLDHNEPGTFVGFVGLRDPTPARAQRFFASAAKAHPGLGIGYTMHQGSMLFFNVTDDKGVPYSGLSDPEFIHTLGLIGRACKEAGLTRDTRAEARFVGNDWKTAPDGQDYARRLDPMTVGALATLRGRHDAALRAAGP
ncbi:MAG TPA: hypothetical protein VGE72_05115 [Azospirillum sp.]